MMISCVCMLEGLLVLSRRGVCLMMFRIYFLDYLCWWLVCLLYGCIANVRV